MHTYRITLGATLISLVHGFVIAPRGVSGLLTRVNGLGEVSPAKRSPKDLTREGMSLFREGKVADSASVFDQVLDADSRYAPYLWQRGLSLYYAGRFKEGSEQFRRDVGVNPGDTEEAIWAFLCEVRLDVPMKAQALDSSVTTTTTATSFEAARAHMLVLEKADRRPFMRVAYELFRGNASEQDLAEVGHAAGFGTAAEFYSQLYLGLYNEALAEGGGLSPQGGEAVSSPVTAASYRSKASSYLKSAVASPYGPASQDYMWSLAKVHVQQRGW